MQYWEIPILVKSPNMNCYPSSYKAPEPKKFSKKVYFKFLLVPIIVEICTNDKLDMLGKKREILCFGT